VLYTDDDFRIDLVTALKHKAEKTLARNAAAFAHKPLWRLSNEVLRERLQECRAAVPPTGGLSRVEEKLVLVRALELELMLIGKRVDADAVEALRDVSTTLSATLRRMSTYHPTEWNKGDDARHHIDSEESVIAYLHSLGAYGCERGCAVCASSRARA